MASSKTDIFNLAITMLGGVPIMSPTQNNRAAIALNTVYDVLRQGELRKKPGWNFAIAQVSLAASATTPLFDRAYSFPLPGDFLAMARPFPESDYNDLDWIVQNGQIYTKRSGVLNIRYVQDVSDTSRFDPLFSIALAAKLASACADAITQSNEKVKTSDMAYKMAIEDAKKANAFDNVPVQFAQDTYWTVRL